MHERRSEHKFQLAQLSLPEIPKIVKSHSMELTKQSATLTLRDETRTAVLSFRGLCAAEEIWEEIIVTKSIFNATNSNHALMPLRIPESGQNVSTLRNPLSEPQEHGSILGQSAAESRPCNSPCYALKLAGNTAQYTGFKPFFRSLRPLEPTTGCWALPWHASRLNQIELDLHDAGCEGHALTLREDSELNRQLGLGYLCNADQSRPWPPFIKHLPSIENQEWFHWFQIVQMAVPSG